MKSPLAYYLLLLYLTVMLKPLIPVGADWWSHEFNESEHISQVHFVYGSNHVDKELADNNANDNSKNQSTLKVQDEVPFHTLQQICNYSFLSDNSQSEYLVFKLCKLPFVHISNIAPPPKFS